MVRDAAVTTFITGADGLIGRTLVRLLAQRGHRVFGLAGSVEAAQCLRRAGAVPVIGDLRESAQWQGETAADWVFHVPPHPVRRSPVTLRATTSR